jgi:hypothetical protein
MTAISLRRDDFEQTKDDNEREKQKRTQSLQDGQRITPTSDHVHSVSRRTSTTEKFDSGYMDEARTATCKENGLLW